MKQKVILFSGKIKAGKSTLANLIYNDLSQLLHRKEVRPHDDLILKYLMSNCNLKPVDIIRKYAYAQPVKQIAKDHFEWDGKKDEKGRKLLQTLGSECGRAYKCDLWVNKFSNFMNKDLTNHIKINNNDECTHVYIIDDWRFINEYENIDFFGNGDVFKIRVNREEDENIFIKIYKYLKLNLFTHESERSLPFDDSYYDFVFDNNTNSIEMLRQMFQYRFLMRDIINFINK